jgi:hypothetical protein
MLVIGWYFVYKYNYNNTLKHEIKYTQIIVDEMSHNVEDRLLEKIKTNKTLAVAPILKKALKESNRKFHNLSDIDRSELFNELNKKWKTTKDPNDAFILEYTNNEISHFFNLQQENLKGEYGEIFLTNKYGSVVASTAKLSTFVHSHKYWWKGSYNEGNGAIFIDDRGYDESVDGYVLGLVIPIKENHEIIGILKVNLNILGAISDMLESSLLNDFGQNKLIRSEGDVIYSKGEEPLSTRIPDLLYKKLKSSENNSFLFYDSTNYWVIGKSKILITSNNSKNYIFGGSFESADHKKGNSGESWFIVNYRSLDSLVGPLKDTTKIIVIFGLIFVFIIAIAAFFFGIYT